MILNAPQCLNRDTTYEYVKPLMGNGLVTLPAEKWKVHRRLINPTFNRNVLKSYIPIFNRETNLLAKLLEKELESGAFDVYKYMDRCTLDTICRKFVRGGNLFAFRYSFNTDFFTCRNHHGNGDACAEEPKWRLLAGCQQVSCN